MYYRWLKYKNKWYYLNDKDHQENPGAMLSDCKSIIDSKTYFFDHSKTMGYLHFHETIHSAFL